MPTVSLALSKHSYDIVVENGALQKIGDLVAAAGLSGHCALITDANVALHYAEAVRASLEAAGMEVSVHLMPPGEGSKTMEQVQLLCRSLIEHHHDRSSFVLALGGGVVGDVAGFVASIFYRGIPYVQVPTTIVAQVDSSIGGKTGVNEPEGKNLIGAFHQHHLVVADPTTLTSLPERVFREGFAEVIKHAAIRDADLLGELAAMDPSCQDVPAELIARNVAIKARIVEEDERETSGTRALLNFGHTVGHAIEASAEYGTLLHGEAISIGMRAALFLSEKAGGLSPAESRTIEDLLRHWRLPLVLDPAIGNDSLVGHMSRDKKFAAGRKRFVLLTAAGAAKVSEEVTDELVDQALDHVRMPA